MVAGSLSMCVSTESISGNVAQNLRFEGGDKAVRVAERQVLVELHVQLHLQAPMVRLDAELMHRHVVARGHGAHAIEDAFRPGFAGNGVDDHVGRGQGAMHGGRSGLDQLAGVLKGKSPRQSQREIGKVAGACPAHTRPLHGQHSLHALHLAHQPAAGFGGNLVHERAHRFVAQRGSPCAES